MSNQFIPWMPIHPGEYVKDLLDDLNLNQEQLAARLGTTPKTISKLINCETPLSNELSKALSSMLGTSISYWTGLQETYNTLINEEEVKTSLKEDEPYLEMVDYSFFKDLGVVPDVREKNNKIEELRKYLRVSKLAFLGKQNLIVNCKQSNVNTWEEKNLVPINAWLQTAIDEAEKIETKPYNKNLLKSYVPDIREMTLHKDENFPLHLIEILKECGVALVYLPKLRNAQINGGVKWLSNEKAMLAMNTRGAYADIFWFTFFHELKHVFQKRTKMINVDFVKSEFLTDAYHEQEVEADEFAKEVLIPQSAYDEFIQSNIPSIENIKKFAESLGVHCGIVIGRLQHDRVLHYTQHNDYRSKYRIIV